MTVDAKPVPPPAACRPRRTARFLTDVYGGAALEFAFIGLPAALLMIGILETGRGLYLRSAVDEAVDRAQRAAIIDRGASDSDLSALIRTELATQLGQAQADTAAIAVSGASTTTADYRAVSVDLPMRLLTPNPFAASITISTSRRLAPLR